MGGCLVVVVARGGLRMLPVVWRRWGGCRKVVVSPYRPVLPGGRFERVVVVDSTVATGMTLLSVGRAVREAYPGAEVLLAGRPRTEWGKAVVDVVLPEPEWPLRDKPLVMVSGYPGVGKSAFARALASVNGFRHVRWGRLVSSRFDVGRYGEALYEVERREPFFLPVELYPVLEGEARGARGLVIDGLKSVEQVVGVSFSLGGQPIPLFATLRDWRLRWYIMGVRGMEDDSFVPERDRLLSELGLDRLGGVAPKVYLDGRTLDEAVPDVRFRRVAERFLGLGRFQVAGLFNPYGTKRILLESYAKSVVKARGGGVALRFSEEVLSMLGGFVHRGYSARLRRRGFEVPDWLDRFIVLTATGFRLIDDILDGHRERWMSEEGRKVVSPWYVHGIHKAVVWATVLTVGARQLAEEHGYGDTFRRWFRVVVSGVERELELEETKREPTREDWLVSALREAGYRAMIAEMLGVDWRPWFVEGLASQLKDDMNPTKGGREDTDTRLNRPIAPRVFGKEEAWAVYRELKHLAKKADRLSPDRLWEELKEIIYPRGKRSERVRW